MTADVDSTVAVIGMAVRLPGAEDLGDLHWLLGGESVEVDEVPTSRWPRQLYLGEGNHQGSHHRGAFLPDPYAFDHAAFGMTATDAVLLDPQQRTMLEVGARALEDAGYRRPGRLDAGVFVGARMNGYGFDHGRDGGQPPVPASLWGRSQNFVATWLSDRLDLAGPSLVVDTACSSSLTAVWLACQTLRAGGCELAVAGAVDLLIDPLTFVLLSRTGALSPDGLCDTFDEAANGYVPGEGAVALVLKPMAAARADGDLILAAIVASGVNNDGRTMGVTTPNLEAQVNLLSAVYRTVDPATVQYVEAHGTGTAIGDPIEVRALSEVFGRSGLQRGSVALGAFKRRIGHLHSAAGLAGLAKIVLCLREGIIPAIRVAAPNARLRLDESPFYLPESPRPWPAGKPRRAAVSSFGFGGTNGHVVAEAVPAPAGSPRREVEVLPLSAASPDALRELAAQWLEFLPSVVDVGGVCATARLARPHRAARVAVTGHDTGELEAALRSWLLGSGPAGSGPDRRVGSRVLVDPAAAAEPPAWLTALASGTPAVREMLDRLQSGAGVELAVFPASLLRISAAAALAVALREAGVRESAVDLAADLQPIADFAYRRASLEQALAAVLGQDEPAEPVAEASGGAARGGSNAVDGGGAELSRRLAGRADQAGVAGVLAAIVAELYEAGHDLDWAAFQAGAGWTKQLLPAAQPRGPALRLPEPSRAPEPGEPVRLDAGPGADGYTFSRVFGPGETPIAQHTVNRRPMLPGAAWFDFLRQGVELQGDAFHGAGGVLFHQPLILARADRVTCRVAGDGRFRIEAASGDLLVSGRLTRDPVPAPEPVPMAPLLASCGRPRSGSAVYRWLRRIGLYHGRYFRNISWLAALPGGRTLARIEGVRQRELNPPEVSLFPGLLDSVAVAAINPDARDFGTDDASVFIPLSVDRMQVFGALDDAAYVETEILFSNQEACRANQVVTDAGGRVLLVFGDITSKRVSKQAFTGPEAAAPEPTVAAEPAVARVPAEPVPASVHRSSFAGPMPALTWFLEQAGLAAELADTEFLSAGFDSVGLVELSDRISRRYGLALYPTVFFEYPTPRRFAEFLAETAADFVSSLASAVPTAGQAEPAGAGPAPAQAEPAGAAPAAVAAPADVAAPVAVTAPPGSPAPPGRPVGGGDIAVVGMAIRVPTARNLADFWSLVVQGRDTLGPLPPGRWSATPGEPPRGSFLERVDEFDPAPFRISAREAPLLDPQARILYETIWEALEDAGHLGERAQDRRTGLWIGYSHDHYHEERFRHGVRSGLGLGLEAMIPNRFSYIMDWHGPSVMVNTLCSSSLVAVHAALQHLRTGDIDTAVVGAVHAAISPEYFESMRELMALSPTGTSHAFDAAADGFAPGEGAVVVVLRRYPDAQDDRDRVYGLVKGAAVNHGGRTTRYTAPNPRAQREVIERALRDAAVDPSSITLMEAHGTGTKLGDPIEIDALTRAWREFTDRSQFCAIGSVKSNVGHLEPAAGLAGMVKVLLAMGHERIPPTLHLQRPNDHIRFEDSPFYLADRALPWPRTAVPRRAAVSAFGMGGVNANVVLEAPPPAPARQPRPADSHLLRVSGASPEAVRNLAASYADYLLDADSGDLANVTFTANVARASHRYRAAVGGATAGELATGLLAVAAGDRPVARLANQPPPLAMLFTGQGSQYGGMGEALYATEPLFRDALAKCAELAAPYLDKPLLELLFGAAQAELTQTRYAQVGIVSVQVGLTTLLRACGIRPDLVLGHSVGELAAAWAAGVLELPDLIRLTATRGQLMQAQPATGSMASVHADADTVHAALAAYPGVEVAAYNAPRGVTVSGPRAAVDAFCQGIGLPTQKLVVSHAFHSEAMQPAVAGFAEAVAATRLAAPQVPFVSTYTGDWHTPQTVADPDTWAQAIRRPVRFTQAMATLRAAGAAMSIEVGPHPVLTPLGRATVPGVDLRWLHTLRRGHPEQHQLHAALASYHEGGREIQWEALHRGKGGGTTSIPTYPFERHRFWVAAEASDPGAINLATVSGNGLRKE